ncbi:MAG: ABC transporter substrate-binding protein [Proteobacteria bacterium]|nr:ABC transporter substrate-binding protein [Pseudomonadota bacterium]
MDIKSTFKIVSFAFVTTFFSSSLFATTPPPPIQTVAITQIIDHPSADAVREGILAALRDNNYVEGNTFHIIYENAQGSPVTASQIAQKFVALKPSVLVPITTPSTQAMVKADAAYSIPIVFAAVTDPVASGVVTSIARPGGHITGATDAAPIQQQFEIFKKIMPTLKTLGVIYNPGDNSSNTPLREARAVSKTMGITLVEAPTFKTADVSIAMQQLAGKNVDAIFVPLDNTVLSAMDAVLKISFQHKIPVFSSDSDSVAQGALASSGYSHFDTGYSAGEMVVQVLKGANPGDIPVASAQDLNVYISPKSAQKLDIEIPQAVLETAKKL